MTAPSRFAVVGSPVAHSLSPVLHAAAYRTLGIEDATYERYDVPAGELEAFVQGGAGRELDGLSVTMPGKPEAFALAAESDETSRALGVSNTLIRRPDGTWRAENHDVHGIVAALGDHGVAPAGSGTAGPVRGAVIGSGSTALSAVAALVALGTGTIVLTARSPEKLAPLEALAARAGTPVELVAWEDNHAALTAEVVVSALAVGGAETVAADWRRREPLAVPQVFLDVLYDPWPAPLAALVAERGGTVADGLEMLAHQADMQVRSMLAVTAAPVTEMLAAARGEVARRASGPGTPG
ncbi:MULTISPECIES: shikimate dehydrogenase [unclassified Brachybacterium]|uniref:shikimate dehydrogenase n=1 Tax=unclassified Brachybacterium TaxID=2623841 RepID=UPI003617D0D2